jgi:D-alanyl-D-alanine carboxypeptidase
MYRHGVTVYLAAGVLLAASCTKADTQSRAGPPQPDAKAASQHGAALTKVAAALKEAGIPAPMSAGILEAAQNGSFLTELDAASAGDPYLYALIDKTHPLPPGYEPDDLVPLQDGAYRIGRGGLSLRREAEAALTEMALAAQADGVTLLASSAYRSEAYQIEVYERNVRQSGQETADRESARPGRSQHQSGLAVDFGSITDAFADTGAGKWMRENASRFGWSLSFPDGYEHITGYRWESWHYRYAGKPLAAFIDRYFGGIQQYALQFIYTYEHGTLL